MKFFCIIVFVIFALTLIGCGSPNAASNTNSATPVNNSVANVNPTTDGNVVPAVPQPVTNMNMNANGVISSNSARKIMESNTGEPVKITPMPAPDDSEFTATMGADKKVIETRVFRSHPQLAKVVRTWLSVKDKKIEVYLRNGKVITLPGDKLDNINSVPASTILDAVGIKPPMPPPGNSKLPEGKRKT